MGGKELIDQACNELNIKQKELAEKIGTHSGTIMNWGSKNEIPLWAEKFLNLLIENNRKDKILQHLREANRLLNT
jgi:DNA-binding transcriptional regulator YiaG